MPNPFPGLDPYVEGQGLWPDFHLKFLNYAQEAIAERLPDRNEVRLDERVNRVGWSGNLIQQVRPDLTAAGTLTLEPATIPTVILDRERQSYIKIFHRPDRLLVTVLELLSPANKADPGRRDYLVRRSALVRQEVHLVEIDLLLGGQRLPMQRPLPRGDAFVLVARSDRRPDCDVFAWAIRQPLPTIPIPLMAPDPDLVLDLAGVYTVTHERGRYVRSADYQAPLTLPLAPEDRAWAEERARAFPQP